MADSSLFDVSSALKAYLEDPQSVPTPEADQSLLESENDTEALNSNQISNILDTISDTLGENPDTILNAPIIDSLQYLLKQSPYLPSTLHARLLDLCISGLAAEAEIVHNDEQEGETETAQHKNTLEAFAFLLQWTISAVEAKAAERPVPSTAARGKNGKGTKSKTAQKDGVWDSATQLQMAMDTMSKVMKLKLGKIFVTTSERDTFIGLFTRPVYLLLEDETRIKSIAMRMHIFRVLCIAIKHHGHTHAAQTSIIQNLTYFEHLAEPMAEFLNILAEQYDYPQLAEEVMKELSNKEFSDNDTKGPRSVSVFVTKFSELAPRVVQKQVTLLAKLLESENYTLRCAIIEVCGNLITMLSKLEEGERGENHKGQINAFFDVLEERFMDTNPYCRCRAIQVLTRLCDLEAKYPKRRQKVAELATQSLEDKSSNVRRNAIKLLAKLIATHPFAVMHGGLLSFTEWNDRLEACENEINVLKPVSQEGEDGNDKTVDTALLDDATHVAEEDQQSMTEQQQIAAFQKAQEDAAVADALNKLQLTRRYYIEALRFIETLHDAAHQTTQLLASKNKSEIIEAMDFFVIADAYAIEMAKPGIRRMLRLIWTKGNSDEGKGVQAHLVECYRGLFFQAPGNFSANDAANYVARNMISLTFGSTPAELTSLEQLLATMMKEKAVNALVIDKLWQVYGVQRREISKQQRRGAIIVLGMLALAEPDIVVREMETCMRIGLGSYGRKDLMLARYTCVALMRMTNLKPAKGEQVKPTARLSNDHAVLVGLESLMEVATESKEWYCLAEQVIGAIYALSKHPDVLCSRFIRRKTQSVFAAGAGLTTPADADGDVDMHQAGAGEQTESKTSSAVALSQLLFAVGHIALKQIVHLELVEQDFKRRKAEKERTDQASGKRSVNSKASTSKKNTNQDTSQVDELDLMAGTTEDDFTEAIAHIRERELLYGPESLLSHFGPLVTEICANNTTYASAELQAQASLCMAKLMCVSSEYCETNLSLLITILERSPSSITRSNLVVALGDMAVCFNHLIDENTDFLYRRLSDRSLQVKRTCLMTLTFLILAGQVKVKGQLGEMAKCVEDEDERVRDMSRMFFAELAGKDNAVYNHFVDMFSLLSADAELDEERFRRVIKFLASFIEKVSGRGETCMRRLTNHYRTSMQSSSPQSSHQDCNEHQANDNGMMWRTPWVCCLTRVRILRRWSVMAVKLLKLPHRDEQCLRSL